MKIGVSGASGVVGAAVLNYLKMRAPAAQLVGISRTPENVAVDGVEMRRGDYDQPQQLHQAYAGLDRLLIIPSLDMAPGARLRQHSAAVEAAVAAGVGHTLFLSSSNTRPGPLNTLDDCYFIPEQLLMQKSKQWTVLRMSLYAEYFVDRARAALAQNFWPATSQGRVSYVLRDDVAAAAAAILAGDGHHGAIYNATGTEALSQDEKAALISRVSGKTISFTQMDMPVYEGTVRQAGLPEFVVEVFRHHEIHTARGGFDIVTGDIEHLTGKPARSAKDFLVENLLKG